MHHCLWAAQRVGRCQALHAIIAFVEHTQSNDVGHGMPSSPLGSTQDRTMSGVACHHRLWAAHTVERRRAWHDITALGQHTRSATTSGVACNDLLRAAQTVERCWAWHAFISLGNLFSHRVATISEGGDVIMPQSATFLRAVMSCHAPRRLTVCAAQRR